MAEQTSNKNKSQLIIDNKELEKTIESLIKRDTPDREIYFDNKEKTNADSNGWALSYKFHFKVFTKNMADPFFLILDQKEYKFLIEDVMDLGGGDRKWLFEKKRNEFLNIVKGKLDNKEIFSENKYLVEWFYKDSSSGDEKRIERKSHFTGNNMKEVLDKMQNSITEEYKITKIEMLPQGTA